MGGALAYLRTGANGQHFRHTISIPSSRDEDKIDQVIQSVSAGRLSETQNAEHCLSGLV